MSAYIVEKKTIDRIVTYIAQHVNTGALDAYYPTLAVEPDKLGQRLWKMNTDAVDQRYSESNPVRLYKHDWVPGHKMQVFKSLRCFLYQCSEGDVPETDLFKDTESLMHTIALEIISDMPQYENAEWA